MKVLYFLNVLQVHYILVKCKQPNIVVVLADDMDYNDVGFRGSNQVQTPNIDALAYNGVVLNRFYTLPTCTPSRTALLTGNYPIRSGMQGTPITAGEERHVPWNMPTLSERLKELNYSTHLVGKWHLGYAYQNSTPTRRGFDSHYGYWNGYIGYFDHITGPPNFCGLDMRDNFNPDYGTINRYATDLFTERAVKIINEHNYSTALFLLISHLAPHTGKYDVNINNTVLEERDTDEMNKNFGYIKDIKRRRYVDIVKTIDDSLGEIMKTLSARGELQNTMILFLSDNGGQTFGMHENFASNWPLRGLKFTHYEGGVRGTAVFYSRHLKRKSRINSNLIHITDLLPTFYKSGGGHLDKLSNIDGINQLETILREIPTKRKELLINIDEVENHVGMLGYEGRYKYINGSIYNGSYDGYYGESGRETENPEYNITAVLRSPTNVALSHFTRVPLNTEDVIKARSNLETKECRQFLPQELICNPCLFDLNRDPCETKNIAHDKPIILSSLIAKVNQLWKRIVPQQNKPVDPNSNPVLYGDTWTTWLDDVPLK